MKFYIETFGCSRNAADSEVMAGILSQEHEQSENPEGADILIINSCIVKSPTENKVVKKINEFSKLGKKLIIAGCMPEVYLDKLKEIAPDASFVGPHHVKDILEAIDGADQIGDNNEKILCNPRIRKNKLVSIIPISSGCSGKCAYCIVRFARGQLFSYPVETIVEEIKNAVKDGCKEIWITSQDNSVYGLDSGTNLAELLRQVCAVPGNFKIRVGMMNPKNVLDNLNELTAVFKNEKIFKFIHIPVQSGSDRILKKMNRNYTAKEFEQVVNSFREQIPDITLCTDVIIGFPGETEEDFEKSMELLEKVQPEKLNISRFTARPRTPAAEMNQIVDRIKKDRSRKMDAFIKKTWREKNKKWIGWTGKVLVDERGKPGSWIGRNFAYRPIVVKSSENLFGKEIEVEVKKVEETYLWA